MKVLNLRCINAHLFEGWFASEAEFCSQVDRDLLTCPLCGSNGVVRLPSAPRLNVSKVRESAPAQAEASTPACEQAVQAAWLRVMRDMVANTEDVGERFPEEARRIHYGAAEERSIRGQASATDAQELRDEGIEVMPLPIPAGLKGSVQ